MQISTDRSLKTVHFQKMARHQPILFGRLDDVKKDLAQERKAMQMEKLGETFLELNGKPYTGRMILHALKDYCESPSESIAAKALNKLTGKTVLNHRFSYRSLERIFLHKASDAWNAIVILKDVGLLKEREILEKKWKLTPEAEALLKEIAEGGDVPDLG